MELMVVDRRVSSGMRPLRAMLSQAVDVAGLKHLFAA
jgi:hypothetical protein